MIVGYGNTAYPLGITELILKRLPLVVIMNGDFVNVLTDLFNFKTCRDAVLILGTLNKNLIGDDVIVIVCSFELNPKAYWAMRVTDAGM